jgi:hypothetical protein
MTLPAIECRLRVQGFCTDAAKKKSVVHPMYSSLKLSRVSWILALALVGFAIFVVLALRPFREPLLRATGSLLVVSEPVLPADFIVVSLDSGGAGALEAADLVKSGIATRVAVFMDPPSGEDHEFIRRGLPYEDAGARQVRQLRSLGVTEIFQIAKVEGTESEGDALLAWCREQRLSSIVFVSTNDHSRRTQRVLSRALKGFPTRVMIQPARYSGFDPDRWWESRGGLRIAIVELQKLLLDLALHPGPM